jgi:hypothetical protein
MGRLRALLLVGLDRWLSDGIFIGVHCTITGAGCGSAESEATEAAGVSAEEKRTRRSCSMIGRSC